MGKEKLGVSFFHSIRFRLIAAFLVPIVCVAALGIISYNRASAAITEEYRNQTLQTANVLKEYVTLIIDGEKEEFKSYLADRDLGFYFKGSLDKEQANAAKRTYGDTLLSKTVIDSKVKDIYFIGDNSRSIMARSSSISDSAYEIFLESAEGAIFQSDPTAWHLFGADDELDAAMGINRGEYALRYVRKLGNLNAVMIIDFDAETLRGVLSILDAGERGYVAIVTTDGREFHAEGELDNSGTISGQEFYNNAVSAESESDAYMVRFGGSEYLFAYSRINENGDLVAALIPKKDIVARTNNIKTFTMILTIIAVVVSLVLAVLISADMLGKIRYILRKLKKVADGDLTTRLHAKGHDEFAMLGGGINNTVGNVKNLITKVNEVSNEVLASADGMETVAGTFRTASDDIHSAVEKIEDGTDRLDSNSSNCLSRMNDLSEIIAEVTNNTEEIAGFTSQTEKAIEEGMESVKGLTDSSDATSRITGDVIETIKELESRLVAVNDVVGTINDIARRTNLLSLNAGIEAARAGEAGRGFTVVAQEIRTLSTQCMESAGKISDIVKDVSEKTGNVVRTAGKAEEIVASQTMVVEKTREAFRSISEQVSGFIASLDTIVENARQMDKARSETLSSIEGISDISAETVSCAGDVNEAAAAQDSVIGNLDAASESLKEKAEELLGILGKFVI